MTILKNNNDNIPPLKTHIYMRVSMCLNMKYHI